MVVIEGAKYGMGKEGKGANARRDQRAERGDKGGVRCIEGGLKEKGGSM